jgi:pilus assembly protein CpaC
MCYVSPRFFATNCAAALVAVALVARTAASAQEAPVHQVVRTTEKMQMVVNTSKVLQAKSKIPRVHVDDPQILELTALSPTEVQISAKKAGVTLVKLWDEDANVYTLEVFVDGDARQLSMLLARLFPDAQFHVIPVPGSVILTGYVQNPDDVSHIVALAQEFHPKVLNHLQVGGPRQVLLRVKVMEVQREKLRAMGFNFNAFGTDYDLTSGVGGLISNIPSVLTALPVPSPDANIVFSLIDDNDTFIGILEALREENLLKILAEPNLVAVSGRPASFLAGGEFPIIVPQSLGTTSVEFKEFGVRLEFVPIIKGHGRVHLEVRPEVSERDFTNSITVGEILVPALTTRRVDTAVELNAGQTLAIAGLINNRVEARTSKVPLLGELPWVGAAFRRVRHTESEVELLILVTPEIVEAMDAEQVPPGGPGLETQSPTDCELFFKGFIEVPTCGPTCPYFEAPGHVHGLADPAGYSATTPTPDELPAGFAPVETTPVQRPPVPQAISESPPPVPVPVSRQPGARRQEGTAPGLLGPRGYTAEANQR